MVSESYVSRFYRYLTGNPSLMKKVFGSTVFVTTFSESRKLIAFYAKFGYLEARNLFYFISAKDIIATF